jgi:hypothetical protein
MPERSSSMRERRLRICSPGIVLANRWWARSSPLSSSPLSHWLHGRCVRPRGGFASLFRRSHRAPSPGRFRCSSPRPCWQLPSSPCPKAGRHGKPKPYPFADGRRKGGVWKAPCKTAVAPIRRDRVYSNVRRTHGSQGCEKRSRRL